MSELISAKYLKSENETPAAASLGAQDSTPTVARQPSKCERLTRWISVVAGVAILAAAVVLAAPFISRATSIKANSPADWLTQMITGKRSDQIMEKWIRDRTELNQREIKEKFTSSPTVQFDPSKTMWNGS
jgi:hypothetical protein